VNSQIGGAMTKYTTDSETGTFELARKIAQGLTPGDILALYGDLGSGKTVFARGLAAGLGITDEVTSPTFALVHEYHGNGNSLYHFDMYRVCGYESLCSTGFFDYMDENGILLVEWSENIEQHLPPGTTKVTIKRTGDNTRQITIESL